MIARAVQAYAAQDTPGTGVCGRLVGLRNNQRGEEFPSAERSGDVAPGTREVLRSVEATSSRVLTKGPFWLRGTGR